MTKSNAGDLKSVKNGCNDRDAAMSLNIKRILNLMLKKLNKLVK